MQKPGLFGMNGFLLFMLTCCSFALRAQQTGSLILVDADNKQPFTIRVGDHLYASSSHGHLVLYHFKDSSYRLNFRIARKQTAELVFPVVVRQKDLGFQIKSADSSWVLYNWQTKQTIRPVNEPDSNRILDMGVKREDGFSRLMSAVVNDTAVMYNTYTGNWFAKDSVLTGANPNGSSSQSAPVPLTVNPAASVPAGSGGINHQLQAKGSDSILAKKNQVSPEAIQPVTASAVAGGKKSKISKQKAADSTVSKNSISAPANNQPPPASSQPLTTSSNPPPASSQPPIANGQPSTAPGIKKLREVNLKISRKMVFLDMGKDGILDTITLFVYYENGDSITGKSVAVQSSVKKKAFPVDTVSTATAQAKNNAGGLFVAGCGEMATSQDLEWLRSAILKANTEQEKIAAATNAFAVKCFSVSQVRVLALLFISDKARYRLMDAARQHISDKDHFRELADMYTDKNFQKKFLAMADKRS